MRPRASTPTSGTQSASERLAQLGWRAEGLSTQSPQIHVARGKTWSVGRVWGLRGRFVGIEPPGPAVSVIVNVEGNAHIDCGGEQAHLFGREALIISCSEPMIATHEEPWARYQWQLRTSLLQHLASRRAPVALRLSDVDWHLIAAVTNTLVSNPRAAPFRGDLPLGTAIASIVVAAAADADPRWATTLSQSDQILLDDALAIVDERFRQPEMGVSELCRLLPASRSRLFTVFARADTTPAKELEDRRVRHVLQHIESGGGPPALSLANLAESAGFRSVSQMRNALGRAASRGPEPRQDE